MTENRAAYEAATIEAMHTGDYAALTAYARTIADVDDAPEPPDLEYTPITDPLPVVVSAAELAELRRVAAAVQRGYERYRRMAEVNGDTPLAIDAWLAWNVGEYQP